MLGAAQAADGALPESSRGLPALRLRPPTSHPRGRAVSSALCTLFWSQRAESPAAALTHRSPPGPVQHQAPNPCKSRTTRCQQKCRELPVLSWEGLAEASPGRSHPTGTKEHNWQQRTQHEMPRPGTKHTKHSLSLVFLNQLHLCFTGK